MEIRKATIEDKGHVLRLLNNFEASTATRLSGEILKLRAYKNTDEAMRNEVEKIFSKPEYTIFIAMDDEDKPVGFILGEIKEKKEKVYDKEGYVDAWYVEANYQGKGTGKLLFKKLVDEFKKANCTHMALNVHFDNTKAIKIYEQMGFNKKVISLIKSL